VADVQHLQLIGLARERFLQRLLSAWSSLGYPDLRVNSYVRSPADNAAAGGLPDSQHLIGTAIDLSPPSFALEVALERAGLVVVPYGTFLHAQLWPANLEPVRRLAPELVRA